MAEAPDWSDLLAAARAVVAADAAAVASASGAVGPAFQAVCAAFLACTGKILVCGSGTSGAVAARTAHLLSVAGSPAFHLTPADGLHGGLGVLRPEDAVLAISKGGASAELNEFCRRARTRAGRLAVITAAPHSELAGMADHVLTLTLAPDCDLGGVIATGSSLAAAALCDALVETLRLARGTAWHDILFTHPSGAVGRDGAASLTRLGATA